MLDFVVIFVAVVANKSYFLPAVIAPSYSFVWYRALDKWTIIFNLSTLFSIGLIGVLFFCF